jgi:hypothetical protein
MTNQTQLAAIAVDENDVAHTIAIVKLTDQHLLAEIAESPRSGNRSRAAAVSRIDDQAVLAHVATHDDDSYVRRRAIQRLNDQPTLAEIAIHEDGIFNVSGSGKSVPHNLACDAVARLNDQALLARVAIEAPRKNAKQWVNMASRSSGLGGQMDAIMASGASVRIIGPDGRMITNEPQWVEQTVSGFAANEAAIVKLTDLTLLAKVKSESKEPSVRDCVDRRLAELSASK